MVNTIELYIYDLSQGMGRIIGPSLIGRPIEGIWHTGIVVFGKEYFYGGSVPGTSGISYCTPGTFPVGPPLRTENLGVAKKTREAWEAFLWEQGRGNFRGETYSLFHNNCNNFTEAAVRFLTEGERGIPQYILDLPRDVLSTPAGGAIAAMVEQMMPRVPQAQTASGANPMANGGVNGGSGGQTPNGSSSSSNTGTPTPVVFNQSFKEDGFVKKMEEFNSSMDDAHKLTANELQIIFGIARGVVSLSNADNFQLVTRILDAKSGWPQDKRFPVLDLLRHKFANATNGATIFQSDAQLKQAISLLEDNISSENKVNSRLSVQGITNLLAGASPAPSDGPEDTRPILVTARGVLAKISDLIDIISNDDKLEVAVGSFLLNSSLKLKHFEDVVLIMSTILTVFWPKAKQEESKILILKCLLVLVESPHPDVASLALSMEAQSVLREMKGIKSCEDEVVKLQKLLQTSADGISLD